ncbi:hypothetical protein WJT86_11475 [Microvirga sp. W0021]|uniref:Uncharacterized protein n=1 Tax=Hohaiivirga grylli TaxID=3133970 RepID=A0ABV0BL78_9HYPH
MSNLSDQTHGSQRLETSQPDEFITIIAPTLAEVMESFRTQGLAEKHYTIVHRAGRHSFTVAGNNSEAEALFNGTPMVAATFARRLQA